MKSNKEILDILGQNLISSFFDPNVKRVKKYALLQSMPKQSGGIGDRQPTLISKQSTYDFNIHYIKKNLTEFLMLFRKNNEFSLAYYESDELYKLSDLIDFTSIDTLVEEWIKDFSKEIY